MSLTCHDGYCHVTRGRIRVRVTNLKNNQTAAKSLQVLMASQVGIKHVSANALTGNVLVTFDADALSPRDVLRSLADLGHYPLKPKASQAPADEESALSELGMKIAKVALKQALSTTPAAILLELL